MRDLPIEARGCSGGEFIREWVLEKSASLTSDPSTREFGDITTMNDEPKLKMHLCSDSCRVATNTASHASRSYGEKEWTTRALSVASRCRLDQKLFDLGIGIYIKIQRAVDWSRPGVDRRTPWPALSGEQQRKMNQAVAMLREATDQGHMHAQTLCGGLYNFSHRCEQSFEHSVGWLKKAAFQGHVNAQSDDEAFRFYHLSAAQGNYQAQYNLAVS